MGPAHARWEGITQGHAYQKVESLGAILEAAYYNPHGNPMVLPSSLTDEETEP